MWQDQVDETVENMEKHPHDGYTVQVTGMNAKLLVEDRLKQMGLKPVGYAKWRNDRGAILNIEIRP